MDAKTREKLALLTAQENACDYCLSAHTAIGKMVGLKEEEIVTSRHGNDNNRKTTAALTFAKHVLDTKGQISDAELTEVRNAGFSDGGDCGDHRACCAQRVHELLQHRG